MIPVSFANFPSFSKETFKDIIIQFHFIFSGEDSYGITFENKFISWGFYMDNAYDVKCGFSFDKNTYAEMTQLLEHEPIDIKNKFYDGMNEIFVVNFKKYKNTDEIIKSHFLHFFEGKIPVYWEQAINEPRHDYYKMFKDE